MFVEADKLQHIIIMYARESYVLSATWSYIGSVRSFTRYLRAIIMEHFIDNLWFLEFICRDLITTDKTSCNYNNDRGT